MLKLGPLDFWQAHIKAIVSSPTWPPLIARPKPSVQTRSPSFDSVAIKISIEDTCFGLCLQNFSGQDLITLFYRQWLWSTWRKLEEEVGAAS